MFFLKRDNFQDTNINLVKSSKIKTESVDKDLKPQHVLSRTDHQLRSYKLMGVIHRYKSFRDQRR